MASGMVGGMESMVTDIKQADELLYLCSTIGIRDTDEESASVYHKVRFRDGLVVHCIPFASLVIHFVQCCQSISYYLRHLTEVYAPLSFLIFRVMRRKVRLRLYSSPHSSLPRSERSLPTSLVHIHLFCLPPNPTCRGSSGYNTCSSSRRQT